MRRLAVNCKGAVLDTVRIAAHYGSVIGMYTLVILQILCSVIVPTTNAVSVFIL